MPWYLGSRNWWWSMHILPWSIAPILLWATAWKGLALWHAARRNETWWFIALLIINTAGILEICYLVFVVKLFSSSTPSPKKHSRKR